MLRLTELRLPLDHGEDDLRAAIVARLGIDDAALRRVRRLPPRLRRAQEERRSCFVYTVDCEVDDEAAVLARHRRRSARAADARHALPLRRPRAGATSRRAAGARPVVIGFGPCGMFAALMLAQMGFRPHRARARQGGARAHQGHLGPVAPRRARSGIERAVRRGRRRHVLRRQAVQPDQGSAPPRRARCSTSSSQAGAPEEILYVAKPHIGTFRLVGVVERMRADDRALGGEIRFGAARGRPAHRRRRGARRGRRGADAGRAASEIARRPCRAALGHSARDTFAMLHERGVHMRGQAVLDRLPHRASAVADRPRALRPERRPSAAGRGRLQAGASRAATAARSTASACARAARWWRRPRSRGASSPTA